MENFAQKLGWPFEGSSVPAQSSVADTTEDVVARVVKKELARFGGTGNTGRGVCPLDYRRGGSGEAARLYPRFVSR